MRIFFFISNLAKFIIWVLAIPVVIHFYGMLYGTLIVVLGAILWNIYQTLASNYHLEQHPWGIFRAMLKLHIYFPLIAYGNFAGPRWGDDNPDTKFLTPIDGTDETARLHDIDMEYAKTLEPDALRKVKNHGDLLFIGRIWTSYSKAHGFYVFGASIGFICRIIGRTIKR